MKVIQLTGPFKKNTILNSTNLNLPENTDYRIIKIGFQIPQTVPLSEDENWKETMLRITLTSSEDGGKSSFYLNANDILEFENIKFLPRDMEISFSKDIGYDGIIDILVARDSELDN